MMHLQELERSLTIPVFLMCVTYGAAVAFMGFGLTGVGHGWVGAIFSIAAIPLVPVGFLGWIGVIIGVVTLSP